MKIVCAPLGHDFAATPGDLDIVLYGYADRQDRGEIGAAVRGVITRSKLQAASRAWDLLSIALSAVATDISVRRIDSPDGWTRTLDLHIAVSDPGFWNSQKLLIEQQLRFLTTDLWQVTFNEGGYLPGLPREPTLPDEDCVMLLSGGQDSLIGVLDKVSCDRTPFVVSQVSQGDKKTQAYFASSISGGLRHLQLNHNAKCPGTNERSQRVRSLIFLAYGVLAATALRRYHDGDSITLYVCENGFISINPPLTAGRIGSLSTRTTHPVFLRQFQTLLDVAELRVRIENPYEFKTKGEMLVGCADQAFLRSNAHLATSCGRYARNLYKHCGRCVPCIVRRAAFHSWGQVDETDYVYSDLSRDNEEHARFDDVRSSAMAIAQIRIEGFDSWLGTSLSSADLDDVTPYRQTEQVAYLIWETRHESG